jgi:hypothetical protein
VPELSYASFRGTESGSEADGPDDAIGPDSVEPIKGQCPLLSPIVLYRELDIAHYHSGLDPNARAMR